ncbi:uncharacterized protein TNCV_4500211 [Trichonephila clavipes]|nr:uncharacterized protein TNCV_4500211 [Trichonephila clavipes]
MIRGIQDTGGPICVTTVSLTGFSYLKRRPERILIQSPLRTSYASTSKECFFSSDEAHFWLNGYVNKQNCRIWSEANPQVYVETPLHPEKLTVWCALWTGGIIGPYFFKNDEGHNVTVNGDRYRAMITNFFIHEFNNHDVQELWFQQDRRNMSHSSCHNRFIERHVW